MAGIEVVLHRVVVCRCGDDHEVRIGVGFGSVECGGQIQFLFGQILLDVFVLNGDFRLLINPLFGDDIYGGYLVMLT